MLLCSSIGVFADSGASALPQDTPQQQYAYKMIAPKTQTTYKQIFNSTTSIKKLELVNNKLIAYTDGLSIATGLSSPIAFAKSPVLTVVGKISAAATFAGTVINIQARKESVTLAKFKDIAVQRTIVEFKWTDPSALKYNVRMSKRIEYKGTIVSAEQSVVQTGTF